MRAHLPSAGTLLGESPKRGAVEQISAAGRYAADVRLDAHQYGVSVGGAVSGLAGAESGALSQLERKLEDRLLPGSATLEQSARAAKQAFDAYAAEVGDIHAEADRVVAEAERRLAAIGSAMSTIASISERILAPHGYRWDGAPAPTMPEPRLPESRAPDSPDERAAAVLTLRNAYEADWRCVALSWRDDLDALDRARTRWHGLVSRRRAAEQRLVAALGATPIGQLITLGAGRPGGRKRAIVTGLVGELRGNAAATTTPATGHPLLTGLLGGSEDGSSIWDAPPDPVRVAAWWKALTLAQREELISRVPWVIGNLPGLPFSARDQANRLTLEYSLAHQAELSPQSQRALKELFRVVRDGEGRPPVSIVALDLGGFVPMVALGYGQLDSAETLTWEVPGMLSDADRAIPGWDIASKNLYEQQSRTLERVGRGAETTALIAFLGYDTPDLVSVLGPRAARMGALRLAAELDGASATRSTNTPLKLHGAIGHSYGTTTLANAALLTKTTLGQVTFVASAGLDGRGLTSFADLHVEKDASGVPRVYTTLASADHLAGFGAEVSNRIQPNPGAAKSPAVSMGGIHSFSSEGHGALKATGGHGILNESEDGYFDLRTQSLSAVAWISVGETDRMPTGVELTEKRDAFSYTKYRVPSMSGGRR